jgi:hypothetical protein
MNVAITCPECDGKTRVNAFPRRFPSEQECTECDSIITVTQDMVDRDAVLPTLQELMQWATALVWAPSLAELMLRMARCIRRSDAVKQRDFAFAQDVSSALGITSEDRSAELARIKELLQREREGFRILPRTPAQRAADGLVARVTAGRINLQEMAEFVSKIQRELQR